MLPDRKEKALAALRRLSGLCTKVEELLAEDAYCPEVLRNVLAMKGHLQNVQSHVLESHLRTCAPRKLTAGSKEQETFITELLTVIDLSSR